MCGLPEETSRKVAAKPRRGQNPIMGETYQFLPIWETDHFFHDAIACNFEVRFTPPQLSPVASDPAVRWGRDRKTSWVNAFGLNPPPTTANDRLDSPWGRNVSTTRANGCPDRSQVVRPPYCIVVVVSCN